MSKKRHSPETPSLEPWVRTYAVTHPPRLDIPARTIAGWDQLVHGVRGVMDVDTPDGRWVIPPHRAVWIPAGVRHSVAMNGRVTVRTVFFKHTLSRRRMPRRCLAVNVHPLLRELVLCATRMGTLRAEVPAEARLARVMLDQLEALPTIALQLPMPRDERALRAARYLLDHPAEPASIGGAVRIAGATRRTLERLFVADTTMTLGRWWRRARLIESLRRLGEGQTVAEVALGVGYASPSSFVATFRRELGTTPRQYFGES